MSAKKDLKEKTIILRYEITVVKKRFEIKKLF